MSGETPVGSVAEPLSRTASPHPLERKVRLAAHTPTQMCLLHKPGLSIDGRDWN